jgi:hypothetical protein
MSVRQRYMAATKLIKTFVFIKYVQYLYIDYTTINLKNSKNLLKKKLILRGRMASVPGCILKVFSMMHVFKSPWTFQRGYICLCCEI